MYNPIIHKEGLQFTPGNTRSLPRHFTPGKSSAAAAAAAASAASAMRARARSKSPGRPQLALVLCPDYQEYPEGMVEYSRPSSPAGIGSRPASPSLANKSRFPFPPSPRPVPHSLARTRGDYLVRDTHSLPASPVLNRVNRMTAGLGREMSLPGSPALPRIHVQDYEKVLSESEVGFLSYNQILVYLLVLNAVRCNVRDARTMAE